MAIFNHWSRKFNWVKRAAAWDEAVDERLRSKQLDEIEKMAKRHAQESQIANTSIVMGQSWLTPRAYKLIHKVAGPVINIATGLFSAA